MGDGRILMFNKPHFFLALADAMASQTIFRLSFLIEA
jgi:hypothetical protein